MIPRHIREGAIEAVYRADDENSISTSALVQIVLDHLEAALEGHVIVPREPSEERIAAAEEARCFDFFYPGFNDVGRPINRAKATYKAMLSAHEADKGTVPDIRAQPYYNPTEASRKSPA